MSQVAASLLTACVLALVHVCAGTVAVLRQQWHLPTLSAAAGLSVAYVFLDLMPSLAEQHGSIEQLGLLPATDRDVYVLALVGLTASLCMETVSRNSRRKQRLAGKPDVTGTGAFWFSVTASCILSVAAGYAVASPGDEAVDPLWLFAVAMGLHFLVNDHSLVEHHGERYGRIGGWLLAASVLAGWALGVIPTVDVPEEYRALVLSYLAGGMIMNILRHEIPDSDRTSSVAAFALGAIGYGILLLAVGPT